MDEKPALHIVWLTAIRPFAYTASLSAVCLGLAAAHFGGFPILWLRFAVTLAGVIFFHTAANLLNDCYDYERGLDCDVLPMSGAVVRGWLTSRQVFLAAAGLLIAGVVCGLWLVHQAGLTVLYLGIGGAILALTYTRRGFCLKYTGLGDLCIFLAFGVLPVFGTYWVQAERFSWSPLLWSLPPVLYTVGILHANNWRDIESDKERSCRTFAGILGDRGSSLYYKVLVLGPFALVTAYVALDRAPLLSLICWLALIPVIRLLKAAGKRDDAFLALDGMTAQAQLVFTVLLCISLFAS